MSFGQVLGLQVPFAWHMFIQAAPRERIVLLFHDHIGRLSLVDSGGVLAKAKIMGQFVRLATARSRTTTRQDNCCKRVEEQSQTYEILLHSHISMRTWDQDIGNAP